jgi:hypothetical protein
MRPRRFVLLSLLIIALLGTTILLMPIEWLPPRWQEYYYTTFGEPSYWAPPATQTIDLGQAEPFCPNQHPEWRKRQTIEGIAIEASPVCDPDNPATVAAFVKGTNNVSMETLTQAGLAPDAVIKEQDRDGDGDPDVIHIRLEVVELNGRSPEIPDPVPSYAIAPGIRPGFWVFAPKTHGMATVNSDSIEAMPLLRVPSPVIRVEQGDAIEITLENTHYLPHSIHFHGVDHPYHFHLDASDLGAYGVGNDGVPETSEMATLPGESHTYRLTPRHPGTMFYHCHVQPQAHLLMGLQGIFVVEENRPNNWVQTFNVGAGHVRYPSVAVREAYAREYDLHYQDLDRSMHEVLKGANDPRLIARTINRRYDITERTADYFLLNGRSFPYTLRESLVVVVPNENVKLRVLNGGVEGISLHPHGQKVTITHYDGVEHNPEAQITRDVVWISPAQRVDLRLNTVNDGLHSYGPGIWLLHDHNEKAFTTDGVSPGGHISAIVYESFLDDMGWPKTQGIDWRPFFTSQYYEKKVPVWVTYDDAGMLSEPGTQPLRLRRVILLGFFAGLGLGCLAVMVRRQTAEAGAE